MSWLFVTVIALNDVIRYVVVCFFQTTFFVLLTLRRRAARAPPPSPRALRGCVFLCSDGLGWNPYISWGFRGFLDVGFLCVFMQDYAFSC